MLAAVLACGPGTVVSHLTAAALLCLREPTPVVVDVIARGESGRGIDGVRRHHVMAPKGEEVSTYEEIPCTSPSRTIVDLAAVLGERSLRRLMEQAAVLGALDVPAIERSLAAARRRGAPLLRAVLSEWQVAEGDKAAATGPRLRSVLEARLLTLIRRSDLPAPLCNKTIETGDGQVEVDFHWPGQHLVVETDGKRFHDNPLAFERDRKRDRALQLRGYRVVRFTHSQIEQEPDVVVSTIRRLLAAGFG